MEESSCDSEIYDTDTAAHTAPVGEINVLMNQVSVPDSGLGSVTNDDMLSPFTSPSDISLPSLISSDDVISPDTNSMESCNDNMQFPNHISNNESFESFLNGHVGNLPHHEGGVSVSDSRDNGINDSSSSVSNDSLEDDAGPLREFPVANHRQQHSKASRPGVILLGRGNSFLLGRSEMIVLHNNRRTAPPSVKHHNTNVPAAPEVNSLSLSSPPISNGHNGEVSKGQEVMTLKNEDLDLLWAKAEAIMFAKRKSVQQVLEEFGVGEGGGEDGGEEEEDVWQVVQDIAQEAV